MANELDLWVCNPSNYARGGFVVKPCTEILKESRVPPDVLSRLTLRDAQGKLVPAQIDPVDSENFDPQNPSRAVLVFYISEKLEQGVDDYSHRSGKLVMGFDEAGNRASPVDDRLKIEPLEPNRSTTRLELSNSQIHVSFGLRPFSDPEDVTGTWWYSGSATSLRLKEQEMLAIWNCYEWTGHDPEKRCMQIDRVCVERYPDVENSAPQEFSLFDRPYELISHSSGPVRVSVTVASVPFDYGYYSSPGQWCQLRCQLFRVISLYANVDYIVEELFVQGQPRDPGCASKMLDLDFSARYFACMDMGLNPYIYQFAHVPDWFAVGRPDGYPQDWHPGYGFACDVHVYDPVWHPAPDFHDMKKIHKTFSWRLRPCTKATCLHLLMHGTPAGFDSRIGHKWYEIIYRPLKARF